MKQQPKPTQREKNLTYPTVTILPRLIEDIQNYLNFNKLSEAESFFLKIKIKKIRQFQLAEGKK